MPMGDEKEIQKFAFVEGKVLLMKHCNTIFVWASAAEGNELPSAERAALLETLARMYQIVEGMPETNAQRKH